MSELESGSVNSTAKEKYSVLRVQKISIAPPICHTFPFIHLKPKGEGEEWGGSHEHKPLCGYTSGGFPRTGLTRIITYVIMWVVALMAIAKSDLLLSS